MIRIFNRYWSAPAVLSLVFESVILYVSVLVASYIRFGFDPSPTVGDPDTHVKAAIFAVVGALSFYAGGFYEFSEKSGRRQLIMCLLRSLTTCTLALWALYFVFPSVMTGRGVFGLSLLLAGLTIFGWRLLLTWVLSWDRFAERILIAGADGTAVRMASVLLDKKHLGYRIVGFVDDDPKLQGLSLINPRVIGSTNQILELARAHRADRVVVAQADQRGKVSMDTLLECKTSGIRVQEASTLYEQLTGKILIENLRKSWLVYSDGFVVSPGKVIVKRILDCMAASIGLVLGAPLMVLTALAVRLESPGPVIYRQERVGRHGKLFTVLKFRSMRADAEAQTGPVWAVKGDPRITRLGKLLRKTRLDEMPQLWNVLIGDMSLVGPRPEREHFVNELKRENPFYEQRFVVRPGLTGWAQINAEYADTKEEIFEKLKLDLYYVKNMSVLLDLSIMASTIRIVLLGKGGR